MNVCMASREDCIDLLFMQCPMFITREQFAQTLDGWDIDPLTQEDGNVSFIFISKGPEFHFNKFGVDIPASRDHLRKYPGEIIKRFGYAITRTPKEDARQQRFNERLGFFKTGETEFDFIYRIEKLRVKEKPLCQ
jgi:hypothetical protein